MFKNNTKMENPNRELKAIKINQTDILKNKMTEINVTYRFTSKLDS